MKVVFEDLMSAIEVARLLGCHPSRVKKLCKEGRILSKVIGGALVIPREALDKLEIQAKYRVKDISEKV